MSIADQATKAATWSRVVGCFACYSKTLQSLSVPAKGYLLGSAFLAFVAALGLLGATQETARLLLWLAGIVYATTLIHEIYLVVAPHAERLWFRWLLAPPIVLMVGAYSLGSAASIVNAATGQDPGLFPRATAFMAPIAALPAMALIALMVLVPSLLFVLFAWMAQLSSKDSTTTLRAWRWLGRFAGVFSLIAFVSPLVDADSKFQDITKGWAGWIAQGLDMHTDHSCAEGEWDRVLRINETLVVVSRRTEQGLEFQRVRCALDVESS